MQKRYGQKSIKTYQNVSKMMKKHVKNDLPNFSVKRRRPTLNNI